LYNKQGCSTSVALATGPNDGEEDQAVSLFTFPLTNKQSHTVSLAYILLSCILHLKNPRLHSRRKTSTVAKLQAVQPKTGALIPAGYCRCHPCSTAYGVKFKSTWSYTSAPPACHHIVHLCTESNGKIISKY